MFWLGLKWSGKPADENHPEEKAFLQLRNLAENKLHYIMNDTESFTGCHEFYEDGIRRTHVYYPEEIFCRKEPNGKNSSEI